jgi:tetratricopeptide (TPR) repeat protein
MYKRMLLALFAFGALISASPSHAQSILNLPRPSQHALVSQRVGITDISVNYSRPLVNNRPIWGKLVPYGQVWRAGANENTIIEFTDPVSVEGKPLAKGVYGLHMIPGENEWTIIFSKNASSWGSFSYKQEEDALRVAVKPQTGDFHEALTYNFDEVKPESTLVTLRWEKVAVPFRVTVPVGDVVQADLKSQLRGGAQYIWEPWDEAATYLLATKTNLPQALDYANRSIQVESRFDNLLTKSQVLDAMGKKDDALAVKGKALEMANAIQLHSYARQLQFQGQQDQALELFRENVKKYPNEWISHSDAARLACAKGDYDNAVKEMKLAVADAPDIYKSAFDRLVKRLEAKEDINK